MPSTKPPPLGIDFGQGSDGIPTAILYRESGEPLIGHLALDEYAAGVCEHPDYAISTQFKPDLATSAEARGHSTTFLAQLIGLARQLKKDLAPLERQVIFGAPSESADTYRQTLKAVAQDAGFGEATIVDEPKGAIYFHLHRKEITSVEALAGTLVVDFGGGTCDFAVLVRGEVVHSWGDMHLADACSTTSSISGS